MKLEQKVIVSEKFAALGRLSAGVAHEITQPVEFDPRLHTVLSEEAPADEEDYRYTDLMLTEVDRLNRVISNCWLIRSRASHGWAYGRQTRSWITASGWWNGRLGKQESSWFEEPCGNDLPLVLMDTDQMTQVFLNILINAIEATPKGGKVFISQDVNDDGRVQIAVEDTGGESP